MALRPATVADARAIAEIQVRAWWRAYQDIVEPALLAAQSIDDREARWRELLAPDVDAVTLVSNLEQRVIGCVSFGCGEQRGSEVGDVLAIYVDPPAQGAGVGTSLLTAAEQGLRDAGYRRGGLWVFVENGLARGFYERRGWQAVAGSEREDDWARELRYERDL